MPDQQARLQGACGNFNIGADGDIGALNAAICIGRLGPPGH
jgi:hypothetical protein